MPPKVSLIIPTYNRAHLLPRALDSALNQDYPALEIIIVDDGSSDNTPEVLAPYLSHPRIRLISHQHNRGVTAAKNTGLDHLPADTVYFGILDSDDALLPDAVSKLVQIFEQTNNQYSQVFGWCRDPHSGEATGIMNKTEGIVHYEDALCGRFAGEFWQLVSKELLGNMRFEERASGAESSVWWPLMKLKPAYLISDTVRLYDRSGTDRVNRPVFSGLAAKRKMWVYQAKLNAVGSDMQALCPQHYAFINLEKAKWAALAGDRSQTFQAVREAWLSAPSLRALKIALMPLMPVSLLRRLYRHLHA